MTNESFKNYFKFPLIFDKGYPYVFTKNGKMALSWLIPQSEFDAPEEIINKINGYSKKQFDEKWSIQEQVFIYYGDKKVFLIRGWGMLTGSGAYNLSSTVACKIQNNFADYIIEQLNK